MGPEDCVSVKPEADTLEWTACHRIGIGPIHIVKSLTDSSASGSNRCIRMIISGGVRVYSV